MTIGGVDKIRKRNAMAAFERPFNYCDRWCDRCDVTGLCKIYQEEMSERLNQLADGEDPPSPECVMKSIKKNTQKSIALIREWAKEEGIDLKSDPFDEEEIKLIKLRSGKFQEQALSRLSYAFCTQAYVFLKGHYYRESMDFSEEHRANYLALEWYHTLLPAKIRRLLASLYQKAENGDKELIKEAILSDAVAQIDLCAKAISMCQTACDELTVPHPADLVPLAKMRTWLNKMEEELKSLECQIDIGSLP